MSKFCRSCGTQLKDDAKFCTFCGTKTQEAGASPANTVPPASVDKAPKETKPRTSSKKHLFTAVAVVLVIALGVAILPKLGKEVANTEGTTGDLSAFTYTERDYAATAKELKVSPESPSASAHRVTIEFGEYALEGNQTLKIRQLPEKTDKNNGVKVTAYDFELGDQTNFDDVITIAIPYDAKYAEAGVESECIGAKYYNQNTGEWESVYYEVDAENRQVLIYTTHLSTYGVFQVKNENTRKAYITDVYAIAGLMNNGKSFEVIQELAEQGQPGNAAFEAGFEAVNSVTGNTGTALTAITLGGQYDGALADALGKGSQHLGLALAAVQTYYDFTYNFSDDQGKLSTLSNLVKNVANNAVGYFGSATLQVGFAAIAVFDVVLSEVQSDMMELKLENLGGVYQYYNDVEAPRSNKEWRSIFIKALKENADDPEKAQQQINQEIDSFCDRFWSLDYGKVKEIAGVSGLKYSFDERQWTKDREVLTAQYREYLLSRLQAPMTSARNYLLSQAMEQAQREFEKQLRALQGELNKTVKVQIIEQPEEDGEYQCEGYTIRFAPLSSSASIKNWSGKMPKGGEMNTSFTVIGHMQSGSPSSVELYKPGEDTPALTVPFKVSYPVTTIYLSSKGEEEQTEAEESSSNEQSTAPAPEKEYAWVLVETIQETRQANIDNLNKGGIYEESASASPGSYTHTWKYVGESDDYPDPDMKRILSAILLIVLVVSLTACANQSTDAPPQGSAEPSAPPETTLPPQTESPSAQELGPYTPMNIFGAEFNPFGMDSPATVFEASFSKGAAKLEGKNPFTLSMTGEGNMYACITYQADVAGLGLDDGGKMELLEEYLSNDGFLEFTDKDGRTVTIRQADPNDDRYEYVEADGSHGASGGGCVIELTYYVPDADIEKYTELVRDNYDLNALSPIADYFDTATDFSEFGISVNLYKNEAKTFVVYYVPDAETIRQNIASNIESDWWEWYGNMETYIAYNDAIGNKLTFDSKGSAVTVEQTNNSFNSPPITDGSLTALGFGFDDAGTCGVYEDREPHYKSVAVARPEWGEHPDDWNIEFMDTDIKGYSLRITYHADDGRYHISVDKDGESCAYDCYPDKDEFGWEYPDIETVHRMFGDAFDSQGKELYYPALAHFVQFVQEHFGMSVDDLYAAPKQ